LGLPRRHWGWIVLGLVKNSSDLDIDFLRNFSKKHSEVKYVEGRAGIKQKENKYWKSKGKIFLNCIWYLILRLRLSETFSFANPKPKLICIYILHQNMPWVCL
jgi:hypothetical protein